MQDGNRILCTSHIIKKINIGILDMQKMNVQPVLEKFAVADLKFLQALLDTSAITRAGELLGMSQPNASRAMNKLRRNFCDPLLVRTARGYVLTPVAEMLRPMVTLALDSVNALFEVATFDAQISTRTFRLASTDYGLSVALLPRLTALRHMAPNAAWQIDPWSDDTIARLERGELDCALYSDEVLPPDFHYRKLFSDGYAFVCRQNHPLTAFAQASGKVLLKEASRFPQNAPRFLASRRYVTDDLYARLGLKNAHIVMASPYFFSAMEHVIGSDLISVVPERLARSWQEKFDVVALPIREKSLRFEYRMIWHERAHRDTGLEWFRERFSIDSAA
nr:LysR family transcriptional regulator [uncultured Albidiferax sp.]